MLGRAVALNLAYRPAGARRINWWTPLSCSPDGSMSNGYEARVRPAKQVVAVSNARPSFDYRRNRAHNRLEPSECPIREPEIHRRL